jgi:MSHA biogenesis protein MshP
MSPMSRNERIRCRLAARGRGFAMPTAIFLMVILALLGVFIVRINTIQSGSLTLDVLGTGAYQAARAGTEWGAFQALTPPVVPACFATTNLTFAGTSLAPFTATVSCVRATPDELGVTQTIYQITATACNQLDAGTGQCPNTAAPTIANYTDRQITIIVGR